MLIVSVVGRHGVVPVSVPSDRPLADMLPTIATLCREDGHEDGVDWALAMVSGEFLPGERSLSDLRIEGGTTLQLVPRPSGDHSAATTTPLVPPPSAGGEAEASLAGRATTAGRPSSIEVPRADRPQSATPIDRTRAVLPEPIGVGRRLSAALGTIRRTEQPGSETVVAPHPVEVTPLNPLALSTRPSSSVVSRVRSSWRQSEYKAQLDAAIIHPRLNSCVTIAVMSPKGGVGKTTVTALLGSMLALLRRDRIVAVDSNPDFGSLGRSLSPDHRLFVDDLLRLLGRPDLTAAQLDSSLARGPHGLLILPAPTDSARMAALGEEEYLRLARGLASLVGVIILDCGTGLQEPPARAALRCANQVVLVSDAQPSTASLVAEASTLVSGSGKPITLVINKMRRDAALDIERFASYLPDLQGLITVPEERAAASALSRGELEWNDAPAGWQRATRELATVLVADWPRLGLTL